MNIRPTRDDWIDFIVSHSPYRYMLTITFKYNMKDSEAIQLLDRLLRFVNRKIYGPRAMNNNKNLKGFVFAERQDKRPTNEAILRNKLISNPVKFMKENGNRAAEQIKRSFNSEPPLHFHILIKDDDWVSTFTEDELMELLFSCSKKLKKQAKKGHDYELFSEEGLDVRSVYDENNLADYVTKAMEVYGDAIISPLGLHGANYISNDLVKRTKYH